ncbi:9276_t:CDS:1, partial [Funneliformis caledonium]
MSLKVDNVTKISEMACPEKILPEINTSSTSQITLAKADDNDLTDLKKEDFCN